jgi:hypothetical protein
MLTHECSAIFPPREEIIWADFKIYDMRAFDRVAAADGTYRPRACYPVGAKHTCRLGNSIKTVLKRSHSCAADQVSIVPVGKRGVPVCEHLPVSDQGLMSGGFYRWVHQEYVASLVTFGEFRVYVATRKGAGGARVPYVVYTIRTWWTKGEQERFRDDDDVHGTNTLVRLTRLHLCCEETHGMSTHCSTTPCWLHMLCIPIVSCRTLVRKDSSRWMSVVGWTSVSHQMESNSLSTSSRAGMVRIISRWRLSHTLAITFAEPMPKLSQRQDVSMRETRLRIRNWLS